MCRCRAGAESVQAGDLQQGRHGGHEGSQELMQCVLAGSDLAVPGTPHTFPSQGFHFLCAVPGILSDINLDVTSPREASLITFYESCSSVTHRPRCALV